MTTHIVTTTEQALAALDKAAPGDTIALAPGTYSFMEVKSASYSSVSTAANPVTFTSLDPSKPAVIEGVYVGGISNLVFDRLKITFDLETFSQDVLGRDDPENVPGWATYVARIENSNNITFQNSVFEGEIADYGIDYDDVTSPNPTGQIKGLPFGGQITVNYGENIVFRDNDISKLAFGIRANGTDGVTIEDNDFHHLRQTPIGMANISDVVISGNVMHSMTPRFINGHDLDHADFIHIFPRPELQSGPQDNIVITGNVMLQGQGAAILGIYLDDDNAGLGYTNVVISDNVLHNGDPQGIRLERVMDAVITNNTLLPADDGLGRPGMNILDHSSNLTVVDNVTGHITIYDGAHSITQSGNFLVQRSDPDAPNYYGDLFVNPYDNDIDLGDLKVMPGSALDGLDVGSSLTWLPESSSKILGVISGTPMEGLNSLTHGFDVVAAIGPSGKVDLTGANYAWTFSDGGSATGATPWHSFTGGGLQVATVTVTPVTGPAFTLSRVVDVKEPFALSVDPAQGVKDLSYQVNAHGLTVPAPVIEVDGRKAIDLHRPVVYDIDDELWANSSYSVSFDFKRDGAAGAATLLSFVGSFDIAVNGDGIYGYIGTIRDGEKRTDWIKVLGAGIDDTDWHNLVLTFSGEEGKAELYLDGTSIWVAEGLEGSVQYNVNGKKLQLGSLGNQGGYVIDDIHVLTGALETEHIAAMADGTIDGNYPVIGIPTVTAPELPGPVAPEPATPAITGVEIIDGDGNGSVTGTDGSDAIAGKGGDDTIWGAASEDMLAGGDGKDTLYGEEGNDLLGGGTDNDALFGGDGADIIGGGMGNDKIEGGTGDDTISGGEGKDKISGDGGDDVIAGAFQADVIRGGAGADVIGGGSGADRLYGGNGDDVIGGGEAGDEIHGDGGADILNGGAGDDRLYGGGGADILNGGAGDDVMRGGDGADQFVFRGVTEGETDIIRDFSLKHDALVLKMISGATLQSMEVDNVVRGGVSYARLDLDGHHILFEGLSANQVESDLTLLF